MTSFEEKTFEQHKTKDENGDDDADQIVLTSGKSFAVVSGLSGSKI
jgi:hypothetical protein